MLSLLSRSIRTTTVRTLQSGSLLLRGTSNRINSTRAQLLNTANVPQMGFSSSRYRFDLSENQTFVPWDQPQMARKDEDGDHASPPPEGVPPPMGGDRSGGDNANSAPANGGNNDGKPPKRGKDSTVLKSVPVTSMKLDSTEADKGKEESFLLFSSGYPILPFNKQQGVIKTGHLKLQHINQPIAYFLTTGKDEIYTIGYVLDTKVNAEIKKSAPKDAESAVKGQGLPETSAYITTKKGNSRIRLTEIVKENDCIFAKAVPYKDRPLSATEKKINVDNEMISVMNYAMAIKKLASHERVDMFMDFEFSNPQSLLNGLTKDKIDEMVFKMLFDLMKLSNITKENITPFVQQVIEERSYVNRVILMRKKLEELYKILEIVTNSSRASDDYFNAAELQHRARLAIEFIRSSYLSSAGGQGSFPGGHRPPSPGRESTGPRAPGGNGNQQQQQQAPPAQPQGQAKDYLDKLHLIKDNASRDKVRREIERFAGMEKGAERFGSEYHKIQTYLEEVFAVPYDKYSEEFWDVDYAKGVLDRRMFGMEKVKERITEMIAVNRLKRMNPNNKDRKGFVVMLYGPPGVGKTSIAKTIGESLKRETRFISFAGVTDPHFMKGHRRTYVDSQPGVFIKELIKAKTMNPVFVIDEVDKLGKGGVGADPYYSLMEILNPEENANFVDHYLDVKVDFSQAIFVLTANDIFNMIEPLRNRLEIIEIPGYLTSEKLAISKQHILPKVQKNYGFPEGSIQMDDNTIMSIIKGWCYYESGCRHLTRCFEKIARRHAVDVQSSLPQVLEISQPGTDAEKVTAHQQAVEQPPEKSTSAQKEPMPTQQNEPTAAANHQQTLEQTQKKNEASTAAEPEPVKVAPLIFDSKKPDNMDLLRQYLGSPVFDENYELSKKKKLPVGAVNVLTVAGLVGNVLLAECVYDYSSLDKKGSFSASGNLKKVISESLTVAKINAHRFLTPEQSKFLAERNVHIHFMHGGVAKDGPSAGISICTAYLSLIMNKEVPSNLSMTGELSLHGAVWKIGGVQEKVAASKALNITKIIIPYGNLSDFLETPKELQKDLTVYCVKEYKEVFALAFGETDKDYAGVINMVKDGKFIPADEKAVLPTFVPNQHVVDSTGGQKISVTPPQKDSQNATESPKTD